MQILSFFRALKWKVCPRCLILLHDGGHEDALCDPEMELLQSIRGIYENFFFDDCLRGYSSDSGAEMKKQLNERFDDYWTIFSDKISPTKRPLCPCCHGYFSDGIASKLADEAYEQMSQLEILPEASLEVKVKLPRSLELMRLIMTQCLSDGIDDDNILRFPEHSLILSRSVGKVLQGRIKNMRVIASDLKKGDKAKLTEHGGVDIIINTVSQMYPYITPGAAGVRTGFVAHPDPSDDPEEEEEEASCDREGLFIASVFPGFVPKGMRRKAYLEQVKGLVDDLSEDRPLDMRDKKRRKLDTSNSQSESDILDKSWMNQDHERQRKKSIQPSLWLSLTRAEADKLWSTYRASHNEAARTERQKILHAAEAYFGHSLSYANHYDDTTTKIYRNRSPSGQEEVKEPTSKSVTQDRENSAGVRAGAGSAWRVQCMSKPYYLLGRYCKYSRDVPQSPWILDSRTLGTTSGFSAGAVTSATPTSSVCTEAAEVDSCKKNDTSCSGQAVLRKGYFSVQEIIEDAVCAILEARKSRLHAAGREDIDVRCLGNGRPFVLEVIGAKLFPSTDLLSQIVSMVNSKWGKNCRGDVQLSHLQKSEHSVWSSMQRVAEEKDKRYGCVVWSSEPLSQEHLDYLVWYCQQGPHQESSGRAGGGEGSDTNSRLCIVQPTPLRVLHRRPLLHRTRYISEVRCILLDPHHFHLSLRTTAGTYVKEWVHGDLGRCTPSVKGILKEAFAKATQNPAETKRFALDICQLDVTWLYDSFEGGGNPPASSVTMERRNWRQHDALHATVPAKAGAKGDKETSDGCTGLQRMSMRSLLRMRVVKIGLKKNEGGENCRRLP